MRNTKHFVITPGWSDLNKGDCAILIGTIQILRSRFPGCSITLISEFAQNDIRTSPDNFPHTLAQYPDVQLVGALFPITPVLKKGQKVPRLMRFLQALIALIQGFWIWVCTLLLHKHARWLCPTSARAAWESIANADFVVYRGGGFLATDGTLRWDLWGLFRLILPALIAHSLGIPYGIFPSSISYRKGLISPFLFTQVLRKASFVCVRDAFGVNVALQFVENKDRVVQVPDLAFLIRPAPDKQYSQIINLKGPAIGVVLRPWNFPGALDPRGLYLKYIETVSTVIEECISQLGAEIYVIAQALGPGPCEDDRLAIEDLLAALRTREHCYVILEDLSPQVLCSLYKCMDCLISTRLHGGILAACAGTPSVVFDYHSSSKARGVFTQLGMSDFVLQIDSLEVKAIMQRIERLLLEKERIRLQLEERVEAARKEINFIGELVASALKTASTRED